jgi:hypothetical protein
MKRRARVAAPGAVRVELTGVVMAPDRFGRIRLLVVDESAGLPIVNKPAANALANTRTKDLTAARLRAAGAADAIVAADGTRAPAAPDRDGAWGVVSLVAPAAHRAHWIAVAGSLRGARARAEVTLRRYAFMAPASLASKAKQAIEEVDRCGVALDLCMLEAENTAGATAGGATAGGATAGGTAGATAGAAAAGAAAASAGATAATAHP